MYTEILIVAAILIFLVVYRKSQGEKFYKYISKSITELYNKYAPYSFKVVREKTKELGKEYTPRQYAIQVAIFGVLSAIISYAYFYSIIVSIIYVIAAIMFVPYLAYLRCNKVYSEFIFEVSL